MILWDSNINAAYRIDVSNTSEQALAPEFYDTSLYSNPIVKRQRSYIRGLSVSNAHELSQYAVSAKVNLDLEVNTLFGAVQLRPEATVLLTYGTCKAFLNWPNNWNPPECLKLQVQSTRLASFQSPLPDVANQAVGITLDVVAQAMSATGQLSIQYEYELMKQ